MSMQVYLIKPADYLPFCAIADQWNLLLLQQLAMAVRFLFKFCLWRSVYRAGADNSRARARVEDSVRGRGRSSHRSEERKYKVTYFDVCTRVLLGRGPLRSLDVPWTVRMGGAGGGGGLGDGLPFLSLALPFFGWNESPVT